MTLVAIVAGAIALALVGLCVALWVVDRRPYRYRVSAERLRDYLQVLLHRGYQGGFMCIEIPGREAFIQFAKYIDSQLGPGLQFDFPRAAWSEKYWDSVLLTLAQAGYQAELEEGSGEDVRFFLSVDLGQDINAGARLAQTVLRRVFDLAPEQEVTLYYRNVSPRDERIGF